MKTLTPEQLSLLVCLILSHLVADFVLQNTKMVRDKRWFSGQMFLHIGIVFIATWGFSFSWKIALVITTFHWLTDGIKFSWLRQKPQHGSYLFFADQLAHLLLIFIVWAIWFNVFPDLFQSLVFYIKDYKVSLLVLGYVWIIWPAGYVIKFALQKVAKTSNVGENRVEQEQKIEHGGMSIGRYERIIILTFVLLDQYEAIGFLITGKSIIRFTQRDENLRSEYVLLGTMMSYAISIITGVLLKQSLESFG